MPASARASARSGPTARPSRPRLLQPEPHLHLAEHRRRGGEVLLGLLSLAGAPGELAEAEVAVGDEGAHPETDGERERLTVMALGRLRVEGLAARGNLAEDMESPGFLSRDSCARERARAPAGRAGLPRPMRPQREPALGERPMLVERA